MRIILFNSYTSKLLVKEGIRDDDEDDDDYDR